MNVVSTHISHTALIDSSCPMDTYEVESCVRGHHVFGSIWSPTIGEQLVCKRQIGNPQDVYAVAVMRGATVVGHVPRKISAALFLLEIVYG